MDVLMPQLGETVLEGTVATWHKTEGDAVQKGDVLLDVETDKAAVEIEVPESGVLSKITVPEGDTVDVGTVLAVIALDGEAAEAAPAETQAEVVADVGAASAATTAPAGLPPKSSGGKLSPAVRRLVKQHDIDIAQVQGTGRNGRITRQDVQAYIEKGTVAAESGRIPFDRFRRITAEHMVRSKATSPHVLQAMEVDFSEVDAARLARKDAWKSDKGYSLTYLPFVARAVCQALRDFPRINASVDGESLVLHDAINLAIAIDLNHEGLVAAVTRDADKLSVPALAEAFADLVNRARNRKLTPDDLTGGTYTLSNPGPFGTLFTAPIINQPQVGILSMDAVSKKATVVSSADGDAIAIRPVGVLAHTFDHRAIDGAYSAAYLQKLKSILESSDWNKEF
jgi:2-oxoglutarate dehydrogenase E2 component (dihydrolipoamide succinyltransferase)